MLTDTNTAVTGHRVAESKPDRTPFYHLPAHDGVVRIKRLYGLAGSYSAIYVSHSVGDPFLYASTSAGPMWVPTPAQEGQHIAVVGSSSTATRHRPDRQVVENSLHRVVQLKEGESTTLTAAVERNSGCFVADFAPFAAATPTAGQSLIRRLDALQRTPELERWPAAEWPSEQAFADARAFIQRLPTGPILMPDMGLADDGEVNFLWKSDAVHIDLGMYGTGAFSYFARTGDWQRFYGDDCPVAHGLPVEIANLIKV